MTDIVVIAILAVVLGLAVGYMVRAKRRGVKCIGCPEGGSCPHKQHADAKGNGETASCCCHTDRGSIHGPEHGSGQGET